MDSTSQFANVAISSTKEFSWVFFVDWVLVVVLVTWLIFHFNRMVGFVVSAGLEVAFWRVRRVRADVQSVKFSLLGGRVFFKNLTFIDKDQTVSIVQGTFTWRYWLPKVRQTERKILQQNHDGKLMQNSKYPCRFYLHAKGVELFIYNRTASYDNIVEQLSESKKNNDDYELKQDPNDLSRTPSDSTERDDRQENPTLSFLSKLLPLQIKIDKGALVTGNKTTQAVFIASFFKCEGIVDLQKAHNSLDIARVTQDLTFDKLEVMLKPNILYDGPLNQEPPKRKKSRFTGRRWVLFRQLMNFWDLATHQKKDTESVHLWKGLAQYLDTDNGSISEIQHTEQEYAKYTTLLTSESCKCQYYYDVPGLVPDNAQPTNPLNGIDIGNGGAPPRVGLDVQFSQSTMHYGPWAERQRHSLHQMLFPTLCKDAAPQRKLSPGELRSYIKFEFSFEVLDDFIVRVPLREFSKTEEFIEATKDSANPSRPFGWIELKFNKDSSMSLGVAQLASRSGFDNRLNMSLFGLEVRSSVNHDILLRCKEHVISSDIGYPLQWDGHVTWSFVNKSKELELFLLREHITLINDMCSDFGSGPVTPYERFRPFTYELLWDIWDYKFFFNINDANIVNNPLDFNDNCYLSVQGKELSTRVHIPMVAVASTWKTVDYSVITPEFSLVVDTPPWHTLNNFLQNKEVGRSQRFQVEGSYTHYSEIGLDLVDTIIIECRGKHVALNCYGFVIKFIMSIKENYFGDFKKFKTLEEHIQSQNSNDSEDIQSESTLTETIDAKRLKRIENETDVHFSFCVEESCIILPFNLYDCNTNMSLHFNSLDLDIRFTNYYMDLQADVSPLKGYYNTHCDQNKLLDLKIFNLPEKDVFFIDGLNIHGHRVFGLPPDEPTCFCKWDITPGKILFNGSTDILSGFVKAFIKLGYGYKNFENHLWMVEPELYDTTQLCAHLSEISCTVTDPGTCHSLRFDLFNAVFKFIDFTNERFIKKISVDVDELRLLLTSLDSKRTLLDVATAVRFTNFSQDLDYPIVRRKQNEHIINHDGPFHRAAFFVDEGDREKYNTLFGVITPSFSLPIVSPPLTKESVDLIFEDLLLDDEDELDENINSTADTAESLEDFIQDFDSQFLPSSSGSGHKSTMLKSLRQSIAGINLKPTQEYEESEFRPTKDANPEFETLNFIFNVGEVFMNASFESLPVVLYYVESCLRVSLKDSMDDLQVSVLKSLSKKFTKHQTWDNIRFVAPKISILLTEESWLEDPLEKDEIEHIEISIENPSLAATFKDDKDGEKDDSFALHILALKCSLKRSLTGPVPLRINLNDVELWSRLLSESTTSLSVRSLHSEVDSASSAWLSQYIQMLITQMNDFHIGFHAIIDAYLKTRVELMYQLAMATSRFKIQHDPAVITRPSYIIRLSKQHIRSKDSWKIIARLRHILDNVPQKWLRYRSLKFLQHEFEAPQTVLQDVLSVFSEWRTWELADIAHSYVFRYVFAEFVPEPLKPGIFEMSIEDSSLTVIPSDGQVNYIRADFIEISGGKGVPSAMSNGALSNPLSLRVSSLKSQLGLLMHEMLPLLDIKAPVNTSMTHGVKSSDGSHDIHLAILLEEVDFKVFLPKTSVSIISTDVELTGLVEISSSSNDLNVTCGSRYFEVDVSSGDMTFVNYSLTGFHATGASIFEHLQCHKLLKMTSDDAVLTLGHGTESCLELLTNMEEDITTVKSMDWCRLKKEGLQESNFFFSLISAHALIKNKKFGWNVKVLDPFVSSGAIDNGTFEVVLHNGLLFIDISSSVIHFDLKTLIEKKALMVVSHHGSQLFGKYDLTSKSIEFDWHYQLTQVVLSDILPIIDSLNKCVDESQKSAKSLQSHIRQLVDQIKGKPIAKATPIPGNSNQQSIIFRRMSVSGLTLCFTTEFEDIEYTLEFQKVLLTWHDIIFGDTKPYGDLEVANTKLRIKAHDVPSNVSELLDMNLTAKVIRSTEDDSQGLQVESSHFHILLHPVTIIKLIQLMNNVKYIVHVLDISLGTDESQSKAQAFFDFSSIHMLSYSFCIGLIFEEYTANFPGIIVGSDKMFFIAEDDLGKFSLISAYLSIARGLDIATFFSLGDESKSPNRAFLPNMQIAYSNLEKSPKKDIQVRVTGEEFDVKFMSSSVFAFEQTLKAMSAIEKLHKDLKPHDISTATGLSAPDAYKLSENLTSIRCVMDFAGGCIQLYRWDVFDTPDENTGASFKVQTPAVQIVTEYAKSTGPKEHLIDVDIFTFSSSNLLLAECVPVVYDVFQGLKDLSSLFKNNSPKKNDNHNDTSSIDFQSLLSKCHIGFALHIDKQELILSCEPSAKVQAVVGIDSIDLRTISNDDDVSQPISGVLDIRNVGASLQHTYSRETSASIVIKELLWSLLLSCERDISVFSAVKFSHIKSYLNLKQLQDVTLFGDLWLPKNINIDESSSSRKSVVSFIGDDEENLVSKFQKAYGASPTPWILDILIMDVGLEVDLGPSLGVISLDLDRCWAVSRKKSLRQQELLVGLDKISLMSKGRLSGYLDLRNLRLNSVIQWSIAGDHQDVPLLLLSAGFDSIETKASFDYNVFLMGKLQRFYITLFNQVDSKNILQDRLVASTECESVQIYITAFAAANMTDIYNTLSNIRQDNKRSYKEDMNKKFQQSDKSQDTDIINMIAALRTEIDVDFGKFLLHVYPGSLLDTQVLIFDLGGMKTHFDQHCIDETVISNLNLKLLDINVALSSNKRQLSEEMLAKMGINEFITHAMDARGGGIFIFPSWDCCMETHSTGCNPKIEYYYKSFFGGKVDIRWNLGSINFIREMWTIHARALSSRLRKPVTEDVPLIGYENIEEKIREVDLGDKYEYIALSPPVIDAPQLRDLGDATPPLEWFGLHRKTFPGLTHQFAITGLQKLVHEVEMQYGHVLGKAS
jgi:hypothetical protein